MAACRAAIPFTCSMWCTSGGRRGGGNVVATAQSDKTDTACATGRGGIYSSDDRVRALTTYKRVLVAAICRG